MADDGISRHGRGAFTGRPGGEEELRRGFARALAELVARRLAAEGRPGWAGYGGVAPTPPAAAPAAGAGAPDEAGGPAGRTG